MEKILSTPFHKISLEEVLEKVKTSIESRHKLQIITLNTEMIIEARKNKQFADIIAKSDLIIPESIGLQIGQQYKNSSGNRFSKLIKATVKTFTGQKLEDPLEIIPGVDLALILVGMCEEFSYKLFLLGGKEGVADKAKNKLVEKFPRLKVETESGGDLLQDSHQVADKINSYAPDILFVALGAPRQELWIDQNLPSLKTSVAIGVGGSLDFWSGRISRAPGFIRKAGLEWLFRLALQPWRIKRQTSLIKFLWLLAKSK